MPGYPWGVPPRVMQKRWQKARFTGFRNRYCSEKLEFPSILDHFSHFIVFERWSIDALFLISKLEIVACNLLMQGQDIARLLQLAIQDDPRLPSKNLTENLAISPSEVSKALRRCVDAGLLYIADGEKRVKFIAPTTEVLIIHLNTSDFGGAFRSSGESGSRTKECPRESGQAVFDCHFRSKQLNSGIVGRVRVNYAGQIAHLEFVLHGHRARRPS